jgi:hypothetical protein
MITECIKAVVDGADGEVYRYFAINRWCGHPCAPPWPVPR